MTKKTRKRIGISPPDLPEPVEFASFAGKRVEAGDVHVKVTFEDCDFSSTAASDVYFEAVTFTKVILNSVRWGGFNMTDARIVRCDLANADWTGAALRRIEVTHSRLTGLSLAEAQVGDVRWVDCKCDHATFQGAKFESSLFENCDLRGAEFSGADLRGVVFSGCDLRNTRMPGARLTGTDFRSSRVDGLELGSQDLHGAIIEPSQLPSFAWLLGVTVKDLHEIV